MSKKKKQAVIVVTISILVAAVIILMMRIGQNTSKTAEKSAVISLADDGTKIKGGGVTVKDQVITITNPGDYTFSGSLSDGRIVIDVSKGTVNVTLNGVDITSSERDVIFSKDSAEVNVIAADGTDNTLVSGTEDFTLDEDDLDEDGTYKNKQKAVIFTKGNLTISGTGSLNVTGNIYNGIQTKGTLSLQDVQLTVNAVHHGVKSKQEMSLISGTYDVTSGEDGFHSDLNITVSDGSYAIEAGDDGIHADGELTVDNGNITINGGTVYVDGPSGGGDSALDYGTENGGILTINGGNVIAIGMSDMLEAVDASSTQNSIMYVFSQTVTKGTEVTVSDSNGNTVFTYTPVKDADSVILSSADLTEGETYTFTYGEQSESITADSVNTTNYTRSTMGPGKR